MGGYCRNLTSVEGFVRPRRSLGETVGAAEMYGFQTTNRIFRLIIVVRCERDTKKETYPHIGQSDPIKADIRSRTPYRISTPRKM